MPSGAVEITLPVHIHIGRYVRSVQPDGSLFYHNMKDISPELHRCLQTHLREIPATGSLKFYYTERSQLYSITAQVLLMNNVQRCPPAFRCIPAARGCGR